MFNGKMDSGLMVTQSQWTDIRRQIRTFVVDKQSNPPVKEKRPPNEFFNLDVNKFKSTPTSVD
jgi:hypothetical protein